MNRMQSSAAATTFPLSIKSKTKSTKKKKETEKKINSTKDCSAAAALLLGKHIAGSFWSVVRRFDLCARFQYAGGAFRRRRCVVIVPLPVLQTLKKAKLGFVIS